MSDLLLLFNKAMEARANAYAPYSGFKVGSAILSSSGQIYIGCNVENVSYPCGTCAEAGAIANMNVNNDRLIKDMIIVADSQNLIIPCGACLQRISEFSDKNTRIHLANLSGIKESYSVYDLLPKAFNEKGLRHD